MSEYIKELNVIYEQYEKVQKVIEENRSIAKDLKNSMIEIMEEQGVDSAVVSGMEVDAVELLIENVEREVLNKKMIAESIGVAQKELSKIEHWVKFTNEGKITPEIIEEATITEETERFSIKAYKPESNEA